MDRVCLTRKEVQLKKKRGPVVAIRLTSPIYLRRGHVLLTVCCYHSSHNYRVAKRDTVRVRLAKHLRQRFYLTVSIYHLVTK